MTRELFIRAFALIFFGILAMGPMLFEAYYKELVMHMMVLGIFAMSLDLLIGYTGLVSFGHAAFFGLAGYLLAIVTPDDQPISMFLSLPICLAGAALAALVIGWFSVRTTGIYFIMITLAFAQMLFYYFNENQELGGSDGIFIFNKPLFGWGDVQLLDLTNPDNVYYIILVSLIGSYFLLRTILNAPFGKVIKGIKANEHRTRALGFNTQRYKLVTFVIAGTMAGFAGYLEAVTTGIISPGHLHWHLSGEVMMLVILGGMGTLFGPVLGAFTLSLLRDNFQDLTEHWHLFQGIFVIMIVLLLPNGIASLANLFGKKETASAETPSTDQEEKAQ